MTDRFPVLTEGGTPRFDPAKWDFRVFGEVAKPICLSYEEFLALPHGEVVADFHCVTTWSRLGNRWGGVLGRDLLALVMPAPRARFVIVHCDGGYTTNVTVETFAAGDVILASRHDGADLTPDHGWPVRLVVPSLYAWKSAKWVRAIEFSVVDKPGFWEVRGYHNNADPWSEERFSRQDQEYGGD